MLQQMGSTCNLEREKADCHRRHCHRQSHSHRTTTAISSSSFLSFPLFSFLLSLFSSSFSFFLLSLLLYPPSPDIEVPQRRTSESSHECMGLSTAPL